jgi:hypothetical protein
MPIANYEFMMSSIKSYTNQLFYDLINFKSAFMPFFQGNISNKIVLIVYVINNNKALKNWVL